MPPRHKNNTRTIIAETSLSSRIPQDFSNVATYLARDEVRAALGVPSGLPWADCNKAVTIRFELGGDYMKSYQQLIPPMLEDGVRVLICACASHGVLAVTGGYWRRVTGGY